MLNDQGAAPRDPRIGTVLDRRYRIDHLLGLGGTGAVYAAWHLNLERSVAIKVLHAQYAAKQEHVERFRLEAQVMGMVGHENAVTVLDFRYASDGTPYIVMELIDGETLRQRLRRGPLSLAEVGALFPPLCGALAQAHERGIIHCDLKPDNLMLQRGEKGEVLKILDFGTSRLTSVGSAGDAGPEQAGTAHYVAPERLHEASATPPDHRIDIFALGAIIYESLTGQLAFGGATSLEAAFRVLHEPVPALILPDGRSAPVIDAVIQRACNKDPLDRYSTVTQLATALSTAVAQAERALAGSFSAAIARPNLPSQALRVPLPPLTPRVISDSKPTGSGVKPVVPMSIAQYVMQAVGAEPLVQRLGPDWLPRLQECALTDWVDGVEMQKVLAVAAELLGGEAELRKIGHAFAAVGLTTTYRSLIADNDPEYVVRRTQVMLRLWYSEGASKSREIAPGQWVMTISGLRALDGGVAAGTAGFIEGYLTMTGAPSHSVSYRQVDAEGPVWEFQVSFTAPQRAD